MIIELNENNFTNNIKSGIILVDFWSDNCNPCKEMLTILDDFSNEVNSKVRIGKLNGNSNMSIVQEYRIMSVPTIIVFKDGKPVEQFIGVQSKEKLLEVTNKYI